MANTGVYLYIIITNKIYNNKNPLPDNAEEENRKGKKKRQEKLGKLSVILNLAYFIDIFPIQFYGYRQIHQFGQEPGREALVFPFISSPSPSPSFSHVFSPRQPPFQAAERWRHLHAGHVGRNLWSPRHPRSLHLTCPCSPMLAIIFLLVWIWLERGDRLEVFLCPAFFL